MPAAPESTPFVFFETIGKKEGLPLDRHKIFEDSSGYIWLFGETGQGTVTFDGAKFHLVDSDPINPRNLPASTVNAFFPEPNGDNWFATDLGVYLREAETGIFHHKPCAFTKEFISILRDKKGTIWAGSKQGLAKLDPKKDSLLLFPKGIINGYTEEFLAETYFDAFPQLFEHPNGKIYSLAVLYRNSPPNVIAVVEIDPDKNSLRYFPLPDPLKGIIHDLTNWSQLDISNNCFWVSTESVLLKFSLSDFSYEKINLIRRGTHTPLLTNVKTAGKDRIWVASSDGLHLFDLAARQYHTLKPPAYSVNRASVGNRCRDILMAGNGTIWCLFEDYLAKIDPEKQQFPLKPTDSKKTDAIVMAVSPSTKQLLQIHLALPRTIVLQVTDRTTGNRRVVRRKIPGSSIGPPNVSKLLTLYDGKILLGMNCGLAWLDLPSVNVQPITSTIEKMKAPMRTNDLWVSDMLEDEFGGIWISTWNAGIIQFQKNNQRFINQTFDLNGSGQQLFNLCYRSIKKDSLGRFVFGSNGTGLEIWDPKTYFYQHIPGETKSSRGLQAKFIFSQYIDKKKRHWIGTENGLYQYSAGVDAEHAFVRHKIDGWIFDILSDSLDRLWIKTTLGLVLFDPSDGRSQLFGEAQGMTLRPSFEQKALFLENNHRLWLGESLCFDPLAVTFRKLHARPVITGLKIHDQPWKGGIPLTGIKHIDLAYNEQTLRFEFTGLDFGVPPGEQWHMVKLEVLPSVFFTSKQPAEWINLGNQPYATFANLAPGKYRLYYRCGNPEAGWLPESDAVTLDFTISPHWRQTWWFRGLLTLALLGVAASILTVYYRFRLRAQQLENEKQQREAERQRLELEKAAIAAESLRKTAESEMKLLRSQLNPHFLFNAMNSINRYILTNDSEKASEYLGQFAQLTRSILDNSQTLTVSLADELKMLNSYIALENLRFRQQITWNFAVSAAIDEEIVQVPSMVLQPFAENAILHGLAPKNGGHIDLKIDIQGTHLCCTLRDNGVGRRLQKSADHKPRHASVGMRLINERLDAFVALEGKEAAIEIVDLKTEQGEPLGTEVRIRLPLVESV